VSSAGHSSLAAIERALESVVGRLASPHPTPQSRELLIEARRLKSLVGSWRSIPPPDEARREMLSRVSRLTARVPAPGDAHPYPPPRESDRGFTPMPRRSSSISREAVAASGQTERSAAPSDVGGPTILRTRMMAWRPLRGVEGVDVKVIRAGAGRQAIAAVRMDVGTELATDALGHGAEIYVVTGDLSVDAVHLHRGDVWSSTDDLSDSAWIRTSTGAELLVFGWDETAAWA
jgi:hypothetical protein